MFLKEHIPEHHLPATSKETLEVYFDYRLTCKLQIYRNFLVCMPELCHFYHLFFFIGLQRNVVTLQRYNLHSLPSYVIFHVCDLIFHVNMNVNMYFEAVLLLVGSLSHF